MQVMSGPSSEGVGRVRTVRDPIHGDIELSPLEVAVVDTRQFQRLRYIRQNGLLHFVFPGAVHTRFAHSLGAFALAKRAFEQLVRPIAPLDATSRESLSHLERAFRLAALLHDVGHCAFSHSIEDIEIDGQPFFGNLGEFLAKMGDLGLLDELTKSSAKTDVSQQATKHEHVSLLLVRRIFADHKVRQASVEPDHLARDIVALIDGSLAPSPIFADAVSVLVRELRVSARVDLDESDCLPAQVLGVLHGLVSGTLDVDRLDYLVRDAFHCGVPYGRCEVEFLLKSIRLGAVAGRPALVLDSKARYALEDMLWSRYQLFVQVFNHKTNIALNAALKTALEDAVQEVRIERPDTEAKFLSFTDDYVMSSIHRVAMLGQLSERSYTKALIDRRIPRHLAALDLVKEPPERREALVLAKRQELANELGVTVDDISVGKAASKIIKENPLYLQSYNRQKNRYDEPVPFEYSTIRGPVEHVVMHFYVDRDQQTRLPLSSHSRLTE